MRKFFCWLIAIVTLPLWAACAPQVYLSDTATATQPALTPTFQPKTDTPVIMDRDFDGIADILDLCPDEPAVNELAGCPPLERPTLTEETQHRYREIYTLPIDLAGVIRIAGDRILLLSDYQSGTLHLYDLADGSLLRSLAIPDLQNDTATLLSIGILLQNYDRQRWRLLDVNGQVLFSADEELEMILLTQNLLVSRAEGEIIFRKLDEPQNLLASTSGYYVTQIPGGENFLIINPGDACILSRVNPYQSDGSSQNLPSDNPICAQPPQFTADGYYLISNTTEQTVLYDTEFFQPALRFSGIPMAVLSHALILLQDNTLVYQPLDDSAAHTIYTLQNEPFRGLTVNPQETWAAIRINDPQQPAEIITLIVSLDNGNIINTIKADTLQFLGDNVLAWQYGAEQVQFLNAQTVQETMQLQVPAVQGLQTAINGDYLLISSSDHLLHVYQIQE